MCQYFSKNEDQCSQVMKQAAKEAFESNMHYHETMKTIAKAYLTNTDSFVQEKVYHILPELKLRIIFPAVYFVNTYIPEERPQILLSKKELRKLLDDGSDIFKKSNIYRCMEKPISTFCNEKYSILNNFCYAEFLTYYKLENKSNKTCKYPGMLPANNGIN